MGTYLLSVQNATLHTHTSSLACTEVYTIDYGRYAYSCLLVTEAAASSRLHPNENTQ